MACHLVQPYAYRPSGIFKKKGNRKERKQHRIAKTNLAESAGQTTCCVIVSEICYLASKNPSNRGRTSDLGITQCFRYSPTLFQLSYRRACSMSQIILYDR